MDVSGFFLAEFRNPPARKIPPPLSKLLLLDEDHSEEYFVMSFQPLKPQLLTTAILTILFIFFPLVLKRILRSFLKEGKKNEQFY